MWAAAAGVWAWAAAAAAKAKAEAAAKAKAEAEAAAAAAAKAEAAAKAAAEAEAKAEAEAAAAAEAAAKAEAAEADGAGTTEGEEAHSGRRGVGGGMEVEVLAAAEEEEVGGEEPPVISNFTLAISNFTLAVEGEGPWNYQGEHADEGAEVEEWEAQEDGSFSVMPKSMPKLALPASTVQLGRGNDGQIEGSGSGAGGGGGDFGGRAGGGAAAEGLPEDREQLLKDIGDPAREFGLLTEAPSQLATPAIKALKAMCNARGANVPAAAAAHKRAQPLPTGLFIVKVRSITLQLLPSHTLPSPHK